ncbi:MAG: MFS transporter [Acetobacteraceae bacterium]|nr:MFS transporter [Acetobacteraceae bacterium]
MSQATVPARIKRIQRSTLVLLILAGTLNYIDRATLSIGGPLIREELGLSIADLGLLLSAFLWAYAFAQLPAGALVDRLGPRWLLGAGLAVWSLAQVAAGMIGSVGQFAVARVFLGLGEAPMFSSAARVVRDWWNVRNRALPTGIWNCTSSLGPTISPPLLTFLMLSFGWRWMFIIMGIVGVAIAIAWYFVYREVDEVDLSPEEHHHLTEGEEELPTQPITFLEWRRLFAFRTTWGLVLGFFGIVYVVWLFQAWLPGYLEIQRHISIQATGLVASIPYAFGVIGSIGGGWVADRLMASGFSPINSRKIPVITSLIAMAAFTYLAAVTESNVMAVACISGAVLCAGCSSGMSWAMVSVAAPENCTASLGSIMNFGGYLGGALAPMTTGFIVQATGSFVPALLVAAVIAVAASLSYLLIIPKRPVTYAELVQVAGS